MPSESDDLIPELHLWNDGRGIDSYGYLSCMGNYELAIVFANYFWPTFIEHDGCIFCDPVNVENYEQWKVETNDDKTAIESVINHVHILDIFPNVEQPPTQKQLVYLGRQLQEMWSAKLHLDFPDKNVVVEFIDDCGEDLLEYQVTFFQHRTQSD